jgi:proteasome lid subunit RPN8/RPN11
MSQTASQPSLADVTPVRVRVRGELLDSMQRIARDASPAEIGWMLFGACVGDEVRIDAVRTLRNQAENPREQFAADPIEQMNAYLAAAGHGMQCIGNAHSHPRGTARMSKQDRDCAHAGSVLLIVAPEATDGVTARAFWFELIHATANMRTLSHEIEVLVEERP